MKKILIIVFGIIVILGIAIALIWNMLPTIISHKLSKAAGVPVSIEELSFSSSMIEVDNIRVGNPSNYEKTTQALSIDTFTVDIPLSRFLDDHITINEMLLDNVYVGLEFDSPKSKQGNWTTIMNNMNSSTSTEKKEPKEDKKEKAATSILIKKLIITDLNIELAYTSGGKENRKLRTIDRIELTDISSEGGIPTAQIMNIVMQETLRNIFSKEGLKDMLDGVVNPSDSGSSTMDSLKGLFSEVILLDNDWGGYDDYSEAS